MTKSAIDYRRVYGELPDGIDAMLYGVLDAEQLRGLVPVLARPIRESAAFGPD
ncbi:hypothetical protein ACVI1J_000048 [Bradyrhizobium diazoefficiens]|uniref:hypothetical protein n=1 Tax=Bradyrhizobium japonicum TaxID=375 RepID=UPI00200C905C|nr:hypothetical protein [Bradyrhizobium japonicum]UQE03775.1 hypothetical protein JEY30_50445 [Bradyrhizobium japonicum]UQE03792.1 hypothetical protein JEY30_49140 [Bradyrhizobium japonicum]WLB24674.1 hypothetical protein QIH95_51355 [Bradyrhizobium japonicum]